jgi:membrane fusion protein, multidrug efflux system
MLRPTQTALAGAALGALLLSGCKEEQRNAYVAPPPPAVTVAHPEVRTVTDYVQLTGTTAAINTVQLVARVEGYLEQIHFEDGQRVKQGDLLFTIEQDQYQAKLEQAHSQVGAIQAQLEHAQTEFDRYSGLFKQKAASAVDVDTWRANLDAAQADLLGAKAAVDLAEINLGYTTVKAPFDGRMGRHLIDTGNLVGVSGASTELAEINRIDPIYAYFTINERDLLRIRNQRPKAGGRSAGGTGEQALQLGTADEEGFPHEGKLDFAAIELTAGTGTLQLRGIFPNPDYKLLPGLFVRIRAPIGERPDALLVPDIVVGRDQAGAYVLTVDDHDVVHRTGIQPGQLVGTMRVVDAGLAATDRVIVDGLQRAVPGAKVTPSQAASPAGAGPAVVTKTPPAANSPQPSPGQAAGTPAAAGEMPRDGKKSAE